MVIFLKKRPKKNQNCGWGHVICFDWLLFRFRFRVSVSVSGYWFRIFARFFFGEGKIVGWCPCCCPNYSSPLLWCFILAPHLHTAINYRRIQVWTCLVPVQFDFIGGRNVFMYSYWSAMYANEHQLSLVVPNYQNHSNFTKIFKIILFILILLLKNSFLKTINQLNHFNSIILKFWGDYLFEFGASEVGQLGSATVTARGCRTLVTWSGLCAKLAIVCRTNSIGHVL